MAELEAPGMTCLLTHHAAASKQNRVTSSLDMMNKNRIDRETMDRKSDSVIPIIQGIYIYKDMYLLIYETINLRVLL